MTAVQEEGESLEDWADWVLKLVWESYRHLTDDGVQAMAVESFFQGCHEKHAVVLAADKGLKTLSAALNMIRTSVGN